MKLAQRMEKIKPSGTIAMSEKAREMARNGKKIYNLDVGEPDFDTPEHIKKAAVKALMSGFTHYTSSRGILELREAISQNLRFKGLEADPEKEIIVTPGAKHAIYCACLATLNPGDQVLVLTPSWPTHSTCVEAAGATAIEVPCGESYELNEEALKEKITSKSRMIIINSPNNPTGGVLNAVDLRTIADIVADHDLLILSDEIYDGITYDNVKVKSMASFEQVRERSIVVNGFSKTYAMTGWRLGYAFADKSIVDGMNIIQQTTTTCPASFVQQAAVAALNGPQDYVDKMIEEYDLRRTFITTRLNEIDGLHCIMPKGAFYVFPDFSCLNMPSTEISMKLLVEEGVCSTPGSAFGKCGEAHIRLSYATSHDVIYEAVGKIKGLVSKYARK